MTRLNAWYANQKQSRHIREKTRFCRVKTWGYKDGVFQGGLVKNSPHKCDTIYLRIKDNLIHLRDDEAFAIINVLTEALWCRDIGKLNRRKWRPEWKRLEDIIKKEDEKA